jgi:hypothetical protein
MASETQNGTGDVPEDPHGLRVVLDLSVADTAVSGTVGLADGSFRRPFNGWIDLMSAINTLRAGTGPANGP